MEVMKNSTPTCGAKVNADLLRQAAKAHSVTPLSLKVESLSMQLSQLAALLANSCGDSFNSFSDMEDDARNWYLTHCFQLAEECRNTAREIAR